MLRSTRKIRRAEPGGIAGKPGRMKERAVVEIETATEEAVVPFSVTWFGEMLHIDSVGAPLQERETCWLNPPSGLTRTVRLADWPALSVEEAGEIASEKSIPVPERLAVCVLGEALSVTVSDPVRLPPADGLNVTPTEQFAPAARLEPQVFVWLKSPVAVIPEIDSVALPALVSFTDWAVPAAPTN